jgi:hypothetical protein
LLESERDDDYDDCIQKEVEIGIAIIDADEINHFVALLVVEDENDVSHQQEKHEVANNHTQFFREIKFL